MCEFNKLLDLNDKKFGDINLNSRKDRYIYSARDKIYVYWRVQQPYRHKYNVL